MNKRLSELKEQAQSLGLTVKQSRKRQSKQDYFDALRQHFTHRDFPQGMPFQELTPMLCFDYWNLKVPERESIWKDGNLWLAQEKFNGIRAVCHFVRGRGIFVHSRNLSPDNYRRTDLTAHLVFFDLVTDVSAVIDTEIVIEKSIDTTNFTTEGGLIKPSLVAAMALLQMKPENARRLQMEQDATLRFKMFDIAFWNGADLRKKSLSERLPYLGDFRAAVDRTPCGQYFDLTQGQLHGKKLFFDRIVAKNGEGVVIKHLNSTYEDSSRRNKRGWVKVKKCTELDGFVSGCELGKPGSRYNKKIACLLFSVATETGEKHLIAKVSSLPKKVRTGWLVKDSQTHELGLHPDAYGKTAHLLGMQIAPKSLRLLHPRIVRWDHLKIKDRCAYSLDSIRLGKPQQIILFPKSEKQLEGGQDQPTAS